MDVVVILSIVVIFLLTVGFFMVYGALANGFVLTKLWGWFIVPVFGGYISGDSSAYRYLADSIQDFPGHEKVLQLMKAQGCLNLKAKPLTNGIVYIYEGTK